MVSSLRKGGKNGVFRASTQLVWGWPEAPAMAELVVGEIKPRLEQLAKKGMPGLRPLVGLAHGDLNAANIMIDALDAVWLIDFATSVDLPLLTDLCKFEMACLFEYAILPITAAPQIGLRLVPGDGASTFAKKGTFLAELSKASPVELLLPKLTELLGVPCNAVTLMHEGRTLDTEKSLTENEITIPGARARREGEKVLLCFDTKFDVMQGVEEENKKQKEAEEEEQKRQLRLQLEQQSLGDAQVLGMAAMRYPLGMREKKAREEIEREEERHKKANRANELFEEQIATQVGVNREQYELILRNPDPDVKKPRHFLQRLVPEQERALMQLLSASGGGGGGTVWAYEVHHQELRERYERAKQGLQADAANIKRMESSTTNSLLKQTDLGFLGPFDPSVNEFCLWHGTARLEGELPVMPDSSRI
eukprot:g1508.t1